LQGISSLAKDLPDSVISESIHMYKKTFAKLLKAHRGYEVSLEAPLAPELSVYVAAFHTAQDASNYAAACQVCSYFSHDSSI
jgi:hypothetical protein